MFVNISAPTEIYAYICTNMHTYIYTYIHTYIWQDGLGGNAKTLMFVNISPADYNAEETATALQYAARVKNITNDANKQVCVCVCIYV